MREIVCVCHTYICAICMLSGHKPSVLTIHVSFSTIHSLKYYCYNFWVEREFSKEFFCLTKCFDERNYNVNIFTNSFLDSTHMFKIENSFENARKFTKNQFLKYSKYTENGKKA